MIGTTEDASLVRLVSHPVWRLTGREGIDLRDLRASVGHHSVAIWS
jgi:hypothetical protein